MIFVAKLASDAFALEDSARRFAEMVFSALTALDVSLVTLVAKLASDACALEDSPAKAELASEA